jgi:predicted nuclease of predicted toxin-antitoxin system
MAWVDAQTLAEQTPPSQTEANEVQGYVARRAKPRFYADENFPQPAVLVLRKLGAKVLTAKEANQRHHPDENHTAYALRNGLILVTCDRDFLDNRRFPLMHCPAMYVFDFGSGTCREIKQAFRCLGPVFMVPQFFDKWYKVDAGRDSWTEWTRYQDGSKSRTRYRFWRSCLEQWVDD